MKPVIINTSGKGWWTNQSKAVTITNMSLGYIDDEFGEGFKDKAPTYGELKVYFDTKTWNTDEDGLIYTDNKFMKELREFFDKHNLPGKDVSYTEQGMQGDDYVSCGVGKDFLKAWGEKFNIDWNSTLKTQQDEIAKQQEKFLKKIGKTKRIKP
jgi:hypothetical protein